MFKTREETTKEVNNWTGGVDYSTLEKAERHAVGWHYYLKEIGKKSNMNIRIYTPGFNTTTGLSKFPYLRDTRRSVGIDNFVMLTRDISGGALMTGTRFADRVAIGAYAIDIHATTCNTPTPEHLFVADKHDTLPYYFPLRAFTNRDVGNLIVSGKLLAASYSVSSATRLQPTCPNGSKRMPEYGNYCVEIVNNAAVVYGPFASGIVQKCMAANGGTACYFTALNGPFFVSLLK